MEEQQFRFNPELELRPDQQAALATTCATEGYKVIHLILRSIVDKYMIALNNASVEDSDVVLARHIVSKTAAQLYTELTDRINYEVIGYIGSLPDNRKPSDPTEHLLDIGLPASTIEDLQLSDFEEGLSYD